jgi:DNA-binding beta-propeller fold protein YncE
MKTNLSRTKSVLASALCCLAIGPLHAADAHYHFLKEIPIGGDQGWDYLVLDAQAHRLYVSHYMRYDVIDLDKDAVVGAITGTPGCHGFALAPELKRGFTSNGKESKSSIVDLDSLNTLSKVATGEKPDSIIYEPKNQEVYTFNGIAKSITIFKASSGDVTATIPLPGKPEFAKLDPDAGMIYVNIEDKNEVAVINTQTHQIVKTWPVTGGESPSSMAIDLVNHRLFIGCGNKTLVVLDSASGNVITTAPIGAGVDATVFDPDNKLIFSSCGSDGVTVIVSEDDSDHYTTVQTLQTAHGARTMAVDPATHKIYLASAEGDKSAGDASAPGKNFRILIYGP